MKYFGEPTNNGRDVSIKLDCLLSWTSVNTQVSIKTCKETKDKQVQMWFADWLYKAKLETLVFFTKLIQLVTLNKIFEWSRTLEKKDDGGDDNSYGKYLFSPLFTVPCQDVGGVKAGPRGRYSGFLRGKKVECWTVKRFVHLFSRSNSSTFEGLSRSVFKLSHDHDLLKITLW